MSLKTLGRIMAVVFLLLLVASTLRARVFSFLKPEAAIRGHKIAIDRGNDLEVMYDQDD